MTNRLVSMPSAIALSLCLALLTVTAWAEKLEDEISFVEDRIGYLSSLPDSPDNQQLKSVYQETLDILNRHRRTRSEIEQSRKELQVFPARNRALARDLKALKRLAVTEPAGTLEQLERMLMLKDVELLGAKGERERIQNALDDLVQRQKLARDELSAAYTNQTDPGPDMVIVDRPRRGNLNEAIAFKMMKDRDLTVARVRQLELELLNTPNRIELRRGELEIVKHRIRALEATINQIQQRIQSLRIEQTQHAMAETLQLNQQQLDRYPPLRWLNDKIESLHRFINRRNRRIEAITVHKRHLQQQIKQLDRVYRITAQQIELSGHDDLLGATLRDRLHDLPHTTEKKQTEKRMNQARMEAIRLDQRAQELQAMQRHPITLFTQLRQPVPKDVPGVAERAVLPMLTSTLRMIDSARKLNQEYINQLSTLASEQEQLNDKIDKMRQLLIANRPWSRSARRIGAEWLDELKVSLQWLIDPANWQQLWQVFSANAVSLSLIAAVTFTTALFLQYLFLPRFRRWQIDTEAGTGMTTNDSIAYAIGLLAGDILLALPLPIGLELTAHALTATTDVNEFSLAVAFGLHALALFTLMNGLAVRLTRPQGVIAAQFDWPEPVVTGLHRDHKAIGRHLIPLIGLIAFFETPENQVIRNGMGRLGLILGCLIIVRYAVRWLGMRTTRHPRGPASQTGFDRSLRLRAGLIIASQIWVIGLAATGYYYGAIVIWVSFVQSYFFLFAIFLLHGIVTRWLLIVQRTMARNQRRDQAEPALPESTDRGAASVRDKYVDVETVSQQTQFILKLVLLAGAVSGLIWIWSEILPALTLLDNITLWNAVVSTDAGEQLQTITLQTFLIASLGLFVAIIAAHNLPGLLELLLLRHLPLNPGTGYAITTVLKYIIVGTAAVITLGMLGMQWSKLQWMVAALSVGLGFGLQEILANFVSGLIILFERPIRIGDTVTINGHSGTISRIRIRATTITDWERMEIILPNKTFITSELTNWSLSDPITRVVFPLTLPYGIDTSQVKRLLLQVAEEHPTILPNPPPSALCLGLVDGVIRFELRTYVNGIGNRLPVTHDVNAAIERTLREHGIELAPPQMSVHIHTAARQPWRVPSDRPESD